MSSSQQPNPLPQNPQAQNGVNGDRMNGVQSQQKTYQQENENFYQQDQAAQNRAAKHNFQNRSKSTQKIDQHDVQQFQTSNPMTARQTPLIQGQLKTIQPSSGSFVAGQNGAASSSFANEYGTGGAANSNAPQQYTSQRMANSRPDN